MSSHQQIIKRYQNALRTIQQQAQATSELSYHPALLQLLKALDPTAEIIHEPKRTVVGRPDFILLRNGMPAGYIEAEAYQTNLDQLTGHAQTQVDAFTQNLDDFLLTNFVEFRLYREGDCIASESISDPRALANLLQRFLTASPLPIGAPDELAQHLARRTRQMQQILHATLNQQLKQPPDAPLELRNLYRAFQESLLPDLKPEEFADLYAQTIAYGLFAARCHTALAETTPTPAFTRATAAELIPPTNPFLRRLFQQLAAHDLEPELKWIADEIAALLHHANMNAILNNFGARPGREDPIVHFYEDFLHAYDPALRELRGVYYTPEPVVQCLVRAVDDLLQKKFRKPLGLADETTLILDPACGTGSFLYAVIEQVYQRVAQTYGEGAWQGYVAHRLLPRLFGFELLVAPYAVAHLKLALALQQHGYRFEPDQRLGVYLTNTLEQDVRSTELLLGEFITSEANAAAAVKRDKPILVVLGNPPYSGHSPNRSRDGNTLTWIGERLEEYKRVDGQPLDEKNPKWLQDDYVKFIRWGQWRIEQTGEGILAFITNHAYLDNPTFRGMRASLLRTFDRLYIVNLHGNARRKETAPDGSPDENVFDIQQGVALLIAVKTQNAPNDPLIDNLDDGIDNLDDGIDNLDDGIDNLDDGIDNLDDGIDNLDDGIDNLDDGIDNLDDGIDNLDDGIDNGGVRDELGAQVFYSDLWGRREAKYDALRTGTLENIAWTPLNPQPPMYLLVPQDATREAEYQQGWRIPDIFPTHSVGIVTARDSLTVHWTRDDVWRTVCRFAELEPEQAREHGLRGDRQRVMRFLQDLRDADVPNPEASRYIQPILYRPFDVRYTFYTGRVNGFHERPRPEVMRHLLAGRNVALIVGRFGAATGDEEWNIVWIARNIVDLNIFRRGGGEVHPLYLYPESESQSGLWSEGRRVNLSKTFLEALQARVGVEASPESVLGYGYAILHAPVYRSRYAEFLRRDFPRIPLPPNRKAFERLAALGQELIGWHLLEHPNLQIPRCKFPVAGDNRVECVRFDGKRVWINHQQYFEPVSQEAWAFRVGGYSVCAKWLSDRKGRVLSFEEIQTYMRVVTAIERTLGLQEQLNAGCAEVWGW
ncbi:MAG: hypothetical protein KatS3mg017_0472 [Fimbriimonadales bacterium]|nr:MAG: hypothetical protein KatS3mg017_0472 [Fimbriimonadales bacterium]